MKRRILIVEDNITLMNLQKKWLEKVGYEVIAAVDEPTARKLIQKTTFDLVFSDIRLPKGSGISLLEWLNEEKIHLPFVVMTDYASFPDAVYAIKMGAKDYLPKPVHRERLLELSLELIYPISAMGDKKDVLKRISPKAKEVERLALLAARPNISVMILGANGTGKEVIAHSIHCNSGRSDKPFVAVNCGGVPRELAASYFFGHVRGAFTGADKKRKGYFEMADGGTLFLDEIGNMPSELQLMLLRVLQEHIYSPVGSHEEFHSDVRIISATNENLSQAIFEGRFREDLYHRLNEFELRQPSLVECPEDILLFADFFLKRYSQKYDKVVSGFTSGARKMLVRYSWPGNIRELKNHIKRAVIVTQNVLLREEDLALEAIERVNLFQKNPLPIMSLRNEEEEKKKVIFALERAGGNITQATRLLNISRTSLYLKLRKFGLR